MTVGNWASLANAWLKHRFPGAELVKSDPDRVVLGENLLGENLLGENFLGENRRAFAAISSFSSRLLMSAFLAGLRNGYSEMEAYVVGAQDLDFRADGLRLTPGAASWVFSKACPKMSIHLVSEGAVREIEPALNGDVILSELGADGSDLIEMVGLEPEDVDLISYPDGVFLEIGGIPFFGRRNTSLKVGIDRRDQDMMDQLALTENDKIFEARKLAAALLGDDLLRINRSDLAYLAWARKARSRFLRTSSAMALEIAASGSISQRSYALSAGELLVFCSGVDVLSVPEAYGVAALVNRNTGTNPDRLIFVTRQPAHKVLKDLASSFGHVGPRPVFVEAENNE